jgi:hypothetical protein
MGETFAQRHWSAFERLAFELTKDCFGLTPTKVFRTQDSKDGGFDSVFIHDLGKLGDVVISHEVLMEAKLRSSHDTLGLRAFAATMIIAFNGRTQCLVVVTNREFSPQALEVARDFQWKSRLQVILVNQRTLSAWVRPRLAQLAQDYSRELLDSLVLLDPADEEFQELEIPGGDIIGTEPPARIAGGRLPNGTLASCEMVLMPPRPSAEPGRDVIGRARRQIVRELADALGGEAGCALVVGEVGSGKSHIVRAVLAALAPSRRCLGIIDLAQTATSRQLFLATYAQLMGIEIAEAARQFTASDAKRVFSTAGGIAVAEDVTSAVLSVLSSALYAVRDRRDVDQIHLTEYLSFVADGGRAGARLLVFHNLDKAPDEVLEFLHAIVPILTAKDVSVLLELAMGGDSQLVGLSQWKAHVELFERAASLGRFAVASLEPDGGVELLLEQLPGLGAERARFICERVGSRPLFLHHAALWLKKRHVVAERAQGTHLIEKPEVFFEGLRPEASVSILDRHIDLWRRELDLPYADTITAATLLNGRLPVAAVRLLAGGGIRVELILDALVTTGLFVPEPRLEGVRVSHSLLLERMMAIEDGKVPGYGTRRFDRKRVAGILLDGIEAYSTDGVSRDLYRSALLAACEQWPEAWQSALRAGQGLLHEHQLAAAAEAFHRGTEVAEKMANEGDPRGALWRIYSLVDLLQVENARYRLGLAENILLLEDLRVSLRTAWRPDETLGYQEISMRVQYLSWRAAFSRENFDEALPIAHDLFARACESRRIDPELAGRAVSALGITLKAVERTDESKSVFDEGVARLPTSAYCRMERWANLAALAFRTEPAQALLHLRRILSEGGDNIPLLDRVHVEADIAMALFLADCLDEAAIQATRATNLADANGIPAQGARGRNILACVHWCEGRTHDAIALLDRAILDAERSYMERFLWRFRVNLASAASEAGQSFTALASARWAEERLVKARASRWAELAAAATHVTSRWYVALLVIGLTYHRCGAPEDAMRLKNTLVLLPNFQRHLEELTRGDFPAEVFMGTTHRHGNHIMITG